MSGKNKDKYNKRRVFTSYLTSVISIALVLFMLGLLGILLLYAKRISDYVKENIGFSIVINDNIQEKEILKIQKYLAAKYYVKSADYITKEQAAKTLEQDLGEDFVSFLGYNPLLPSIEVKLKANYANNDSLIFIEKEFKKSKIVKEIVYQKSLVTLVNKNIKKIGLVLLSFTALLLIISIVLINNTIRLSVYAKRFLLKSMLLIGATQGYIRKPFLIKGLLQGLSGGLLALILLSILLYFASGELPDLISFSDVNLFLALGFFIISLGIIISLLSNYFAVRKYLKIKTDYLYYH